MTQVLHLPKWWHRKPVPAASPIAAAAAETGRLTAELNRVVEQLRRLNDHREKR